MTTGVVEEIKSKYDSYDIASHGFISDIVSEEQKIEKKVMERELDDSNIQWLSEKLKSINKELNERTRSTLIIENAGKKGRNRDIGIPEYDEINIDDKDDAKDIISENNTREKLE